MSRNVSFSLVLFILLFRGKQAKRPGKTEVYDEDDPEAYKDMPVPDKVRHADTSWV